MSRLKKITPKAKKASFRNSGYDAIDSQGKRKPAQAVIKHEDAALRGRDRRSLQGVGTDLYRNFSMVSWAVRKHLDYNTHFNFQVRTDNEELNNQIEALMKDWSRPNNCDASGRLPFAQMIRLAEARHILDGDFFFLKRKQGFLNSIEADLIRNKAESSTEEQEGWFNGVKVNKDGRPQSYYLHKRDAYGNYQPLREIPARNMIHLCHFDRFDQVRGISPLAAAYNTFRDVYEGVDYALAKMKVEQLFALVIHSGGTSGTGEYTRNGDGTYDVDFGRGPVKLELDNDDDAKFLTSDNHGSNTQEFIQLVLSMAIKALDLPVNFVDESRTNFFGSRAAWMLYDRSCLAKRGVVLEMLRRVTVWKLRQWIISNDLTLPSGMTILDIDFEWVHVGMPWWDPAKEIAGDVLAIQAGLDNPYRICKERGRGEFEENLRLIARAQEKAEELGVALNFAVPEGTEDNEQDTQENIEYEDGDDD